MRKTRDLPQLCDDRYGRDLRHTAQRLQPLNDRAHLRRHALHGPINRLLRSSSPAPIRMWLCTTVLSRSAA
jgi:hypothetical protein